MLPCMRLAVAAAKGTLGAVQAEWAALQQEQQHLQQLQQQQGHVEPAGCHSHLLNVSVWGSYVNALGKVGRKSPATVHSLMQEAVEHLADVYHAAAWAGWARRAARSQQQQQQQQVSLEQQWQLQAQKQALQAWQRVKQLDEPDWHDLEPAAVLPQEVAHCVRTEDRDRLRSALNAALMLASSQLDEAWMQRLMKLSALLKVAPREWGYDTLLSLRIWQGAPPEAIEELLCELMGWGVAPSLQHFEHLAEAYALHREVAAAEAVLDRMQAAGHTPLLRTYNRLLSGIAMNGDMGAATRVFARLKTQGLAPDEQTMRALFKCVRLYAGMVRVNTARKQALGKPGDVARACSLPPTASWRCGRGRWSPQASSTRPPACTNFWLRWTVLATWTTACSWRS
ncbi:hypothetical protein COO60DRAFT_996241 [Scenedesmus sp. NREL 46B-D3]|nr:hypothetical protein COO60DRAFT_996241 [Scenedesmus sp. NREL 46B-D3]